MRNLFGGDPHFNNVVLQLPLRSHLRDESKTPKTVTVNGDTKVVNGAAYFDGTGDYLQIPDSPDFEFGSSDFAIQFKVKFTGWPGNWNGSYYSCVLGKNSTTKEWVVYFGGTSSSFTNVSLNSSSNGSSWATSLIATYAFQLNREYDICITRKSGTGHIFIDSRLIASADISHSIYAGTQDLLVGRDNTSSLWYGYPTGYISDMRITKGVARLNNAPISPHGVAALNRRAPIVGISEVKRPPILRRRTQFYGDPHYDRVSFFSPLTAHTGIVDIRNGIAGTLVNNAWLYGNASTPYSGVHSLYGSVYSDGSEDRIYFSNSKYALGTSDFTVEFWIYPINGGGGSSYGRLLQIGSNSTEGGLWIVRSGTSNPLQILCQVFSTSYHDTGYSGNISNNKWHHIALCRVGTTYSLFCDGYLETRMTESRGADITQSVINIGANSNNTESFNAYFSHVRITKGIARYTSNFKLPGMFIGDSDSYIPAANSILPVNTYRIAPFSTNGVSPQQVFVLPTPIQSNSARPPIIDINTNRYVSGVKMPWKLPGNIIAVTHGNYIIGNANTSYKIPVSTSTTNSIVSTNFSAVQIATNEQTRPKTLDVQNYPIAEQATIIAEVDCTNTTSPQYQRFGTLGNEGFVFRGQNGTLHTYGYVNSVFQQYSIAGYSTGRHIYAATFDGAYFKIYKDGTLLGTSANFNGKLTSTSNFYVSSPGGGEYIAGSLLRSACFNKALSLTEINNWAYGQDTERLFKTNNTFVRLATTIVIPETGKKVLFLSAKDNLIKTDPFAKKVLYHVRSDTGIIYDLKGNTVQNTDNYATISYAIKPFEKSSIKFIVSSSRLVLPTFNFWGDTYTIDGYFYCISGSGSNISSSLLVGEGQYSWGLGIDSTNTLHFYYWNGSQIHLTGGAVATNKWLHFALTHSGGVLKVWIDGISHFNNSVSPSAASNSFYIGQIPSYTTSFNGYMKDIRVTKGLRYSGPIFYPDYTSVPII